jgi:putative oxidoreductase
MNPQLESKFGRWQPHALALLRIVTAYMFLVHGTAKLLHLPHVPSYDSLQIMSLPGAAGLIELVCGVLILIGWFTRPAAFIASGEMAVAYFMAHASQGNPLVPLLNRGELAVMYSFVFLFLAVAGAGAWSIDSMLRSRTTPGDSGERRSDVDRRSPQTQS